MRPDLEKLKREFQKSEFEFLTKGILLHVEAQERLERYTLFGVAAVYAWLFTVRPPRSLPLPGDLSSYYWVVYWIPPMLIVFSMIRSASLLFTLEMIYSYIQEIERDLKGQPGFQAFVVNYRQRKKRMWLFRTSLTFFWFLLLAASGLVALFFTVFAK